MPDGDCKSKCLNGECDASNRCVCRFGYVGQFCQTAMCYPNCMHGGNCTAPAKCSCPTGYQGDYCEGGKYIQIFSEIFIAVLQPNLITFVRSW